MSWIPATMIGPAAGVATSVLWVATSVFFTAGGRRIGPTAVNALRIGIAILLLGSTHRLLSQRWFPDLTSGQLTDLGLSGLIGLTICDQALFTAFVTLGPRRSLLVMTTSPLFALAFGAAFLDEFVGPWALIGIVVTLGGVLWVVLERPRRAGPLVDADDRSRARRGLWLAVLAAGCQAAGSMLSKRGMGHGVLPEGAHLDPQAATFVRMLFGGLGMLPIVLVSLARHGRRPGADRRRLRAGLAFTACGAVVGPYLGVWLSLVAFDHAPIGVAQTLCSLSPVLILPLVHRLYGEHVGARAWAGALLAVGGSALLFVT